MWYVRGVNDSWPGECAVSDDKKQYLYYNNGASRRERLANGPVTTTWS